MRLLHSVGFLVLLAAPQPSGAQPLTFDRLDSRDGLPHNLVHALAQDADGALWIGTAAGLAHYDGLAFTVFRHRPGHALSLSSSTVRALALGTDGTLWIGTAAGIDRYDRRTGRITHHALDLPSPPPTSEAVSVAALASDPDGSVWALTLRGGLFHLRPGERQAVAVGIPTFVSSLAVDEGGTVWITTQPEPGTLDETLRHYDHAAGRFQTLATTRWIDAAHAFTVHSDGTGTVWLNARGDRSVCATGPLPCLPDAQEARVGHAVQTPDGTLWLGTDQGLLHTEPSGDVRTQQPIDRAPNAWLSNNVQALLRDRAGALWVGTLSGLYRHDPYRRPFTDIDLASAPGRRDGAAMALHVEDDGTLWAGTLGGGLVRVGPDGTLHRAPTTEPGLIWALHEDRQGTLWAGFAQDGLCAFDRRTERFDCLDLAAGLIAEADDGMLWVAGSEILRFDPVRRRVLGRFPWPSTRNALEGALLVNLPDIVWVGADGLYRCEAGHCARPNPQAQARLGLDAASVYALHADAQGALWLGTTRGVAHFDPATETFRVIEAPPEMEGLLVYSILGHESGALWIGTSRGLARLDPATEVFRLYDPDDRAGLPEYNRRAAFHDTQGRLYFGHLDGVTAFDPRALHDNPVRPTTILTRATRMTPDGLDVLGLAPDKPLTLSHRDRLVRFEFAALSFTHADENRYRYRLDGLDTDWVEAGTERHAVYTALPPGRYTFRVQGSNNDGLWSAHDATLALLVTPPFWASVWFRLLAVLALGGLLLTAHRYRVAQLLRVERVRARIASDLHDEVGSKLAALALTSETIARRIDLASPERHRLGEMATTARRMAEDLRDIVWLASPRFDTVGDLVEKMRTTTETVLGGVTYTFRCPDGEAVQALDVEQRRQLFLLYKETLRNIARHADADHVEIELTASEGILRLDVTDDGVGFDHAAMREATGLASLEERARALGGRLEITTRPNAGTAIRLRAPLRRMAGFRDGWGDPGRLRSSS